MGGPRLAADPDAVWVLPRLPAVGGLQPRRRLPLTGKQQRTPGSPRPGPVDQRGYVGRQHLGPVSDRAHSRGRTDRCDLSSAAGVLFRACAASPLLYGRSPADGDSGPVPVPDSAHAQAGPAAYAAAGALVGTAVGTRLVGVLLLVPFLLQHLPPAWYRKPAGLLRALVSVRTGVFLAALVVVAIACEPFSVLEPGRFFGDDELLTWRRSLDVSLGELVFSWSLYDIGTTPFLFHLTDLLPYSLGLPLFAAAVAGCLLAVILRNRTALLLLSWVIVYFAAVGSHHLKPVRYVLPLLPPLVVLAAWACALCVPGAVPPCRVRGSGHSDLHIRGHRAHHVEHLRPDRRANRSEKMDRGSGSRRR